MWFSTILKQRAPLFEDFTKCNIPFGWAWSHLQKKENPCRWKGKSLENAEGECKAGLMEIESNITLLGDPTGDTLLHQTSCKHEIIDIQRFFQIKHKGWLYIYIGRSSKNWPSSTKLFTWLQSLRLSSNINRCALPPVSMAGRQRNCKPPGSKQRKMLWKMAGWNPGPRQVVRLDVWFNTDLSLYLSLSLSIYICIYMNII